MKSRLFTAPLFASSLLCLPATASTVEFEINLAERLPALSLERGGHVAKLFLFEEPSSGPRKPTRIGELEVELWNWKFTVPQCLAQHIHSRFPSDVVVRFIAPMGMPNIDSEFYLDFLPPQGTTDPDAQAARFRFALSPLNLRSFYQGTVNDQGVRFEVVNPKKYCHPMELELMYPVRK